LEVGLKRVLMLSYDLSDLWLSPAFLNPGHDPLQLSVTAARLANISAL
jgi:hypothetical protein